MKKLLEYILIWLHYVLLRRRPSVILYPSSTLYDRNILDTNAGCILRLALWPKPDLWTALFDIFDMMKKLFDTMLGVHFRCGDRSFNNSKAGWPFVIFWRSFGGAGPETRPKACYQERVRQM